MDGHRDEDFLHLPTSPTSPTECDHEINLVDATRREASQEDASPDVQMERTATRATRITKSTLREELARRKYARFQEARYADDQATASSEIMSQSASMAKLNTTDKAWVQIQQLRDKNPFRSKVATTVRKAGEYEIDILYENQRGVFFCGIPLYSSRSLLNLDPAAWQTSHFHDSPVNITNAQLPDPSWMWDWKTWYVDMSYDVDEEGWQYSLAFRHGFSWHGSHPWFHSFVRRRRWLRKRVKIHGHAPQASVQAGHSMAQDYFTIHATARESSRESSLDRTGARRSSLVPSNRSDGESEVDNDLSNAAGLKAALKKASIDRRKLEAFETFLAHGGDELLYLADHMAEIMATFVYQASRRQALAALQRSYDAYATKEPPSGLDPEAYHRTKENLSKTILAAHDEVRSLEYWSDARLVHDEQGNVDHTEGDGQPEQLRITTEAALPQEPHDPAHDEVPMLHSIEVDGQRAPVEGPVLDPAASNASTSDQHDDERRPSRKGKERESD